MLSALTATIPRPLQVTIALLGMVQATTARAASPVTFELLNERASATQALPSGPLTYLVTPAGRVFRMLGSQPILGEDGAKIGNLLSYVGDTRDLREAEAHSLELVKAWGPDAAVQGETAVLVEARIGFDPRKSYNYSVGVHFAFQLKDGRWAQLPKPPPRLELAQVVGTGPIEPIDQPGFPFDRAALEDAAKVAERWFTAMDAGDEGRLMEAMTEKLSTIADSRTGEWHQVVTGRARLRSNGPRRELFRLQSWEEEPSIRGTRLWFKYSVDVAGLGSCVEMVKLAREKDRWRVDGFGLAVQPDQRDVLRALMSAP